jgi:ParB-like chromosome segregation protein Spo0J
MIEEISKILKQLETFDFEQKVELINNIKIELSKHSPFKDNPVDCVIWVKNDLVRANQYNPNKVAPPEMKLLETSIIEDGYTQPIVTWQDPQENGLEVVDGFHRNRVGKESDLVRTRVNGYLPIVQIRNTQTDKNDRIASTIRHNRARGKHGVEPMSDIVIELKKRNWSNEKISKNLGMEEDEILRLCQISGLADLFKDQEFSKSWNIEDQPEVFVPIDDSFGDDVKEENGFRTVNTNDENRIFHTYEKWECYKAGFYESSKEGLKKEDGEKIYADFLSNEEKFREALERVITEWKYSCEHYLTNSSMNRIAWLGQASLCISLGIPAVYRSGFNLLSAEDQTKANKIAHEYLNKWLVKNGMAEVSYENAITDRQSTIY